MTPAAESMSCPSPFNGRWTTLPDHASEVDPTMLPAGFRAGGVAAGIKPSGRKDFALLVSDTEATVSAARFTSSGAPAAPVEVCRSRVDLGAIRACVVNSGNANAATGPMGRDNAFFMQGAGAMACGVPERRTAVASTGVIGVQLDTHAITKGAAAIVHELARENGLAFAEAICTTDRWIKAATLDVDLGSGTIRLSAQAKGAGMIAPRHATLLAFVETDARLTSAQADRLLGTAVAQTFDRVSVDAQMSTNDSVFLLASGEGGVEVPEGSGEERLFYEALEALLKALALSLVKDGEGAGRVAKLTVSGGDAESCERVARAIADSPLVKTALAGGDPNWGRILQAAGMVLATGRREAIDVVIEGRELATAGIANAVDRSEMESAVSGQEIEYEVRIPGEGCSAVLYFSDLGHDYVTLNGEYTT